MLDQIQDTLVQQWNDLLVGPSGPVSLRFSLQIGMAIVLAGRDGLKNARSRRTRYFWTNFESLLRRDARLHDGLNAIGRVLLMGLVLDTIYQSVVLKEFYPLGAVMVAVGLAFTSYLLARGLVDLTTRLWSYRDAAHRSNRISSRLK